MWKVFKSILFTPALIYLLTGATVEDVGVTGLSASLAQFKTDSKILSKNLDDLGIAIHNLEQSKPESLAAAKNALAQCRLTYKRIEYFLEYFFPNSSRIYNRAPKHEIEEPFMEYQAPAGFQYMEVMLFDSFPENHKSELKDQIELLNLSANDLNSLLYQFAGTESELLESIRLQLIRIISLGITGFDAPSLKTGIRESSVSLKSIEGILTFYSKQLKPDSTSYYLKGCIKYLDKSSDFDSFNRLYFLTNYALPFQKHLGAMIRHLNLETNKYGIIDYNADHIFSPNSFSTRFFPDNQRSVSQREIVLGEKLFFERKLSGGNKRNCASCHNPENYFADMLARSIGFEPNTNLKRNTPSLLYSSFQHNQFWDGRVNSLEKQIEDVIRNPEEMNGDLTQILQNLNTNKAYNNLFRKAFKKKAKDKIKAQDIYKAISSYVRTLSPYTSKFDQYINGNRNALTESQISGFNLFMGKAQCGTCHFAPLFNGLVPPAYTLTEFEILGTPGNDDLNKTEYDSDEGRFYSYPIPFYKNAFKTPTVRNSAVTAPYMHNGAFKSLETVIEFYNRGGGAGIGLKFPNQTLSPSKLNLTDQEKKDILSFLQSLTDDISHLKK